MDNDAGVESCAVVVRQVAEPQRRTKETNILTGLVELGSICNFPLDPCALFHGHRNQVLRNNTNRLSFVISKGCYKRLLRTKEREDLVEFQSFRNVVPSRHEISDQKQL